jgi:replication factor C subunit 3/5
MSFFIDLNEKMQDLSLEDSVIEKKCWIYGYKPSFDNLVFPDDIYRNLYKFVEDGILLLSMIIYGIGGSGKMTMVKCIIKHCFNFEFDLRKFTQNPDVNFLKVYKNYMYIDLAIINRSHEDKFINYVVKNVQRKSIDGSYKVVIIKNIHKLYKDNQKILVNLISKKSGYLRILGTTNNMSSIVSSLKSNCFNFRLRSMNNDEFSVFAKKVISLNKDSKDDLKISKLPKKQFDKIFKETLNSTKESLMIIQSLMVRGIKSETYFINKMILDLLNLCSGDTLLNYQNIRDILFNISTMNYNPNKLILRSVNFLLSNKNITNNKKKMIMDIMSSASVHLSYCDREIFTLEFFFFNLNKILSN